MEREKEGVTVCKREQKSDGSQKRWVISAVWNIVKW